MAKTTQSYSQTVVPSWYTGYAKDTLSAQNAVFNRPWQADTAPRIAGFTPTQQAGFDMTQQAAGSYAPILGGAVDATNNAMGRSSLGAASPFLSAAADNSGLAPAYGALGTSGQFTQASTNPTGLNMAMPFLQQASNSAADGVGNFMNPYLDHVVNRYGELGARTLREELMPAIENKYIQAGQLGGPTRPGTGASGAPSGMMTDTARAVRDVNEGVGQLQLGALSQGFSEALGASGAEKDRMLAGAGTAGNLGFQQQGVVGDAGRQFGALGQNYANIDLNDRQLMSTVGGQVGSLYGADTGNRMAGAGQLAQLAQQTQTQGLTGASAVTGVGAQQQALEQAGLDVRRADWLLEQGYPQAQIDAMARTGAAVQPALPQGSITIGSSKGTPGSLLGSVAGAGLALAGSGAFKGK